MASLFLLAFTFVMTVVLGAPIAGRLARIQIWRAHRLADARVDRAFTHIAFFEPVDFGPVLTLWPSEVKRPETARPLPPWPSATWDDDHFGKWAGAQRDCPDEHQASDTTPPPTSSAPQQQRALKNPKRTPRPTGQPTPVQQVVAAAEPTPPKAETAGSDTDAIERLVAERGLAGAVQHLMQENGWDFRTAASFLANARRR